MGVQITYHWEKDGVGVLRHGLDKEDSSLDVLDASKRFGPEKIRLLLSESLKTIDFHFNTSVQDAKDSFEMEVRRRLYGPFNPMISKEDMIDIISSINPPIR